MCQSFVPLFSFFPSLRFFLQQILDLCTKKLFAFPENSSNSYAGFLQLVKFLFLLFLKKVSKTDGKIGTNIPQKFYEFSDP